MSLRLFWLEWLCFVLLYFFFICSKNVIAGKRHHIFCTIVRPIARSERVIRNLTNCMHTLTMQLFDTLTATCSWANVICISFCNIAFCPNNISKRQLNSEKAQQSLPLMRSIVKLAVFLSKATHGITEAIPFQRRNAEITSHCSESKATSRIYPKAIIRLDAQECRWLKINHAPNEVGPCNMIFPPDSTSNVALRWRPKPYEDLLRVQLTSYTTFSTKRSHAWTSNRTKHLKFL